MKLNEKNIMNHAAKAVAVFAIGFLAFSSSCTTSNTSQGMGGTADTTMIDNGTGTETTPSTDPGTTPSTDPGTTPSTTPSTTDTTGTSPSTYPGTDTTQPVDSTRR